MREHSRSACSRKLCGTSSKRAIREADIGDQATNASASWRRQCARCGLILSIAAPALSLWAPSASASARCGSSVADRGANRITAYKDGPTSCRTPLLVVKEFRLYLRITGTTEPYGLRRFPGWRCSEGARGIACTKRRRVASLAMRDRRDPKDCGTVRAHGGAIDGHLVTVRVNVARGSVSCSTARRVIAAVIDGRGTYHSGSSNATSYFVEPGGWHCPPPGTGLASCARGRASVTGSYRP